MVGEGLILSTTLIVSLQEAFSTLCFVSSTQIFIIDIALCYLIPIFLTVQSSLTISQLFSPRKLRSIIPKVLIFINFCISIKASLEQPLL